VVGRVAPRASSRGLEKDWLSLKIGRLGARSDAPFHFAPPFLTVTNLTSWTDAPPAEVLRRYYRVRKEP